MNNFFSFDTMITPAIIKFVFWLGLAVTVLVGLGLVLGGLAGDGGGSLVVLGLVYLVLGPILVRVYCELIIVLFRMHDALREIRDNTSMGGRPAPPM